MVQSYFRVSTMLNSYLYLCVLPKGAVNSAWGGAGFSMHSIMHACMHNPRKNILAKRVDKYTNQPVVNYLLICYIYMINLCRG